MQSITKLFNEEIYPRLSKLGFKKASNKKFVYLSDEGVVAEISTELRTDTIKRFYISISIASVYERLSLMPMIVGGKFPDLKIGQAYNANSDEIIKLSIGYIIDHYENKFKYWLENAISHQGYMNLLIEVQNKNDVTSKNGWSKWALATGHLSKGQISDAKKYAELAIIDFKKNLDLNPSAIWPKDGILKCEHILRASIDEIAINEYLRESKKISILNLNLEDLLSK